MRLGAIMTADDTVQRPPTVHIIRLWEPSVDCARCIEELEARDWDQPRDEDLGFWVLVGAAAAVLALVALLAVR